VAYKLIRERGRGGFGVVEEVQGDNGNHYARKTLVVPSHLDPAQVSPRFEREVKYQGAIRHNHVVGIVDHDLAATPPWFVMYLAECSLFDEMSVDRTLGGVPGTALFHILAGLEEIHRLGYCHRDLKPHNVLKLKAADGSPVYALSDFGLMAVGEEASSTLTPSGIGGGTPAYQAPECALNFKRATSRSDIYSFGAMLHDIFAPNPKRLPHEELTAPGDIGPVIEKCTKRNAFRRYKNVEQLRDALFNALDTYQFVYQSDAEQKVVEFLSNEAALPTSEQWDAIFDFLDSTTDDGEPTKNIFRTLRRDHIEQLSIEDPDLMAALGKMYADHCRLRIFGFDYCDVLASKAELFYELGETGLKADIAIAMLILGLEHNRWFVERKFLQMVGPSAADAMIQRVIVEMSVLKINFKHEFGRMQRSISVERDALHPLLQQILEQ
jgi:eukaryotic-like serine/threonine-protein kinase